jgi:hypothetical protein
MAYLVMQTRQAAQERTRDAWTTVLGRPKRQEDVTEFLWGTTAPGLDGRVALNISERPELLSPQEQRALVAQLDPINWPPPPPITVTPGSGEV